MNLQQYQLSYPRLANFANNPNSPTYTRKSKTGKTVVVRKGKRKSKLGTALNVGFVAGIGGIGGITGNKMGNQIKRLFLHKKNTVNKIANPAIKGSLIAAGTGVGLVSGVLFAHDFKTAKRKLSGDRGKK